MANDLIGVTDRGNPGLDGLNFLSGSRNPTQQEGRENELWLNIRSQVVFQKVASRWVPRFRMKGEKGDRGDRGFSLRSGDGPPDAAVGRDGDIYVQMVSTTDVQAPALWGPKINGSWSSAGYIELAGPQGDQGETGLGILYGAGAPSNGDGRNGEIYLRASNADLYGKAAGVWSVLVNLKGPQGDASTVPGPSPLNPVEEWATATSYIAGPPASFVNRNGSSYECLIPHVSGDFATDLAAGKWGLVAGKGLDGLGTGSVNPSNTGALAGKLARFVLNDGTEIADAIMASATDFHAGTDDNKPLSSKTIKDAAAQVPLTSGSTVATNAATGRHFRLEVDHNFTLSAPTGLEDGQWYVWLLVQGSTGGTGAFDAIFDFGGGGTPTLSTGVGKVDRVVGQYDATLNKIIADFRKGT